MCLLSASLIQTVVGEVLCVARDENSCKVWYNTTAGWIAEWNTMNIKRELISTLKEPCKSAAKAMLCHNTHPDCVLLSVEAEVCSEDCIAVKAHQCYTQWEDIVNQREGLAGISLDNRLPDCDTLPRRGVTNNTCINTGITAAKHTSILKDVETFEGSQTPDEDFQLLRQNQYSILIGAKNVVYNISLTGLTENVHERLTWFSTPQDTAICRVKTGSEAECHNYIRVLLFQPTLLVCGTHSYKPRCRLIMPKMNMPYMRFWKSLMEEVFLRTVPGIPILFKRDGKVSFNPN